MKRDPDLRETGEEPEYGQNLFSWARYARFENADAEDIEAGVNEKNSHDQDDCRDIAAIRRKQQSAGSYDQRADGPFAGGRISAVDVPDIDERKRLQKALERERDRKVSVIKKVMHERFSAARSPLLSLRQLSYSGKELTSRNGKMSKILSAIPK